MNTVLLCFVELIFVVYVAENVGCITVKPCPTNKIAPHRRGPRYDHGQTRTFGHIFSLFVPDDGNDNQPGGLQEDPQADDPDDCGDIEDYDENDLSSLTRRKHEQGNKRFFHGPFGFLHGHYNKPTYRPEKSTYRPTRPPPGGYFGSNPYRPQMHLNPSDHLKPVQEYDQEPQMVYRPGIVGVPLGHVVGMHQLKTTKHNLMSTTPHNKDYNHKTSTPQTSHRHPKARNIHDNGIIQSFINLLF